MSTTEVVYQEEISPDHQAIMLRLDGDTQRWDLQGLSGGRWKAEHLERGSNPLRGQTFYSLREAQEAVLHAAGEMFQTSGV